MQAQIWNNKAWSNFSDARFLQHQLDNMLEECDFEVLDYMEHYFSPYGYTAIWLLGESHLALHTFPEEGKAYIELSSCNKEKHDKFAKLLSNLGVS